MMFSELAQARYSCRKFLSKPVETEKLEQILKAAQAAPTGVNAQPFRLLVIIHPKASPSSKPAAPMSFRREPPSSSWAKSQKPGPTTSA